MITDLQFLDRVKHIKEYYEDKIPREIRMMNLVVEKSMEDMKKLTEAFEKNNMVILKNKIR